MKPSMCDGCGKGKAGIYLGGVLYFPICERCRDRSRRVEAVLHLCCVAAFLLGLAVGLITRGGL